MKLAAEVGAQKTALWPEVFRLPASRWVAYSWLNHVRTRRKAVEDPKSVAGGRRERFMIYDLGLTICASRREEALTRPGVRSAERGAEVGEFANVPPNCAKHLECVAFSDAFRVMTAGAPRAVLKPPRSKRFATANAILSLAPGFSPVSCANAKAKPITRFSGPEAFCTGLMAGANENQQAWDNAQN